MNPLQALIERIVGYEVDWSATAGWAQAFGAVLAVLAAAGVARTAELDRRLRVLTVFAGITTIARDLTDAARIDAESALVGTPLDPSWPSRFGPVLAELEAASSFEIGEHAAPFVLATFRLNLTRMAELMGGVPIGPLNGWIEQIRQLDSTTRAFHVGVVAWRARAERAARWWFLPLKG